MTCIDPPELSDLQLTKYLDGDAGEGVQEHIARCSHCRERAKQMAQAQNRWRIALHRLSCPDSDTLRDYEFGFLSIGETAEVERHLGMCPHCTHHVAELRGYIADLAWEDEDASEEVGVLQRLRWFVADLVQGGPALTPAFAAVRGVDDETSKVFEAGDMRIDTTTRVDAQIPEWRVLIGSVLGPEMDVDESGGGWRVDLWQGQEHLASEALDELGSFRFSGLLPGEYELIINGPDAKVRVPSIKIA